MQLHIDFKQIISGLLTSIQTFPTMWLIVGLFLLIRLILFVFQEYKLAKSGIAEIDKMAGEEFEKYLQILFSKLGYLVKKTGHTGDFGADLVLEKNGVKTAVQAKRHNSKIGIKAVQEAVGSLGLYKCQKAMVVTNNYFTEQAKILAKSDNVELWDRNILINKICKIKKTNYMERPTGSQERRCILCNKPVSDKVYQYCIEHSDRFKGKIYCFDCQKKINIYQSIRHQSDVNQKSINKL